MIRAGFFMTLLLAISCRMSSPPFNPSDLPNPPTKDTGPAVVDLINERQTKVLKALESSRVEAVEAVGRLGQAYQAFHFRAEALSCYELAVKADPENPKWLYFLGLIHKRLSNLEAAHEAFSRVLAQAPNHIPSLLENGDYFHQKNENEQAQAQFNQALAEDPKNVGAMAGLARVAIAEKEYVKALKHIERAIKLQPDAGELHYLMAMAYRGLGELDKMNEALELKESASAPILQNDPWMEPLNELAQLFFKHLDEGDRMSARGNYQSAIESYRQALDFNPHHYEASTKYAWSLLGFGQKEEALAAYRASLKLRSNNPIVFYNIGGILAQLGRDDEAISAFESALKYDPEMTASQLFLADALRRQDRLDEAVLAYEKSIEMDGKEPAARLGRALTLIKQGQYAQALSSLKVDMDALPGQRAFILATARLLSASPNDELRDGMRAAQLLEPLAKGPSDVDTDETIAMVMAENGRFDLAVKYQSRAVDLARMASLTARLPFLEANLDSYQSKKPCRNPWPKNDPLFSRRTYKQ